MKQNKTLDVLENIGMAMPFVIMCSTQWAV